MKKILILIFAFLGFSTIQAQHQINSFFDEMGIVRLETQELSETSDTLMKVYHRSDDIVWSRVVYRIVDMRFKQNYPLYNPVSSEDPQRVSKQVLPLPIQTVSGLSPPYRRTSHHW